MALNFTANQYESAFSPTKLCNWGVQKKSVAPKKRDDVTKIIVDDRGHLLPSVRKYARSPWSGFFHHTNLSRKNTRTRADDMAHGDILSTWEKRSAHVPVIAEPSSKQIKDDSIDKENKSETKSLPPVAESYRSASPHSNKSNGILHDIKNHPKSKNYRSSEPILTDVFTNELVAKNLRLNNQKHHRLPDAVDNDSYNGMEMRRETNPGLALNIDPTTSAIGCKIFQSPGPTQCSKLKVFRPQTAVQLVKREDNDRPKTTSRIKKKSKPLSEMDLAIYWDIPATSEIKDMLNPAPAVFAVVPTEDYRKEVTDAEVPSLVGSDNSEDKVRSKHVENPSAVMDVINTDPKPDSRADICDKPSVPSSTESNLSKRHSSTPSLSQKFEKNSKPKELTTDNIIENCSKVNPVSQFNSWGNAEKRSKSSPNLANVGIQVNGTKFGRPCVACEQKRSGTVGKIERPEYKTAFKAGKPTNYKIDEGAMQRLQKSRNLKVPKPKVPFARKNYSIGTLAPPFSIWPRTGGLDYPDHWRLASVYQHSYKPLEARKAPLIKTVFQ